MRIEQQTKCCSVACLHSPLLLLLLLPSHALQKCAPAAQLQGSSSGNACYDGARVAQDAEAQRQSKVDGQQHSSDELAKHGGEQAPGTDLQQQQQQQQQRRWSKVISARG
jgi:hypothetical protein